MKTLLSLLVSAAFGHWRQIAAWCFVAAFAVLGLALLWHAPVITALLVSTVLGFLLFAESQSRIR